VSSPSISPAPRPPRPRRWRRRAREALELLLIPLACGLLPWRWSLRLLGVLARWRGWFREEVELASRHARRAGFAPDPAAFERRLRWRLLVDALDPYLVSMRRRRRYVARWVQASGDALPERGPLMLLGTHHGCGFWFLPYMCTRELPLNIVAPPLASLLGGVSLPQRAWLHLRHRLLIRAAGRPLIYRGGASRAIAEVLGRGDVGFGLCDMPTQREDAVAVELAGRTTRLAQNMFELAARQQVPVVLFWSDTVLETGVRRIHFQRVDGLGVEAQVRAFAAMLDELIRRDPTGWRFWSIANAFFPDLDAEPG
jgi:hypothetical protein